MDLFADDEQQVETPLQINESYANRFEHNKQRAELHRLEEKYGKAAADILAGKRSTEDDDDEDDDDSSDDDETEDEEGEQVTAEVDAAILRTLAKIRSGDASIYDPSKKVFDEEKALAASSALLPRSTREKLGKKVTLADYQRNRLRDLMNNAQDPALALAEATTSTTREDERARGYDGQQPLSHVQEQEQLRKQVTQAFHGMDAGDNDEGDIFTKRAADTPDEGDPAAYRRYLLDNLGENERVVREALRSGGGGGGGDETTVPAPSAPTKRKRKSTAHDAHADNEEFLMNYILNRGWMENPQSAPRLSSRRAKQEEGDEGGDDDEDVKPMPASRNWEAEAADLDAASDASFDSRAEAFEQAFNFRYEAMEAGKISDQVQSYARQNTTSVRRTEDKRKQEREERRKRKEAEKRARMEEIDRMRELKRGTLRDKLKQLREAAGSQRLDIDVDELEGDFDPDKHDRLMRAFGDAYYDEEGDDDVKPQWDDDVDIDDILADERQEEEEDEEVTPSTKMSKNQRKKEARRLAAQGGGGGDEERIEMDAAFMDGSGEGGGEKDDGADVKLSKKDRKKLKKAVKKAASRGEKDDVEDDSTTPTASTSKMPSIPLSASERQAAVKQLADEYRSLDYEDVIGDLPTRFHYTPVTKTDYGLTPIEILLADDKDLNEVVGLKYFQPYRRGGKRPKELTRKLREFRRRLEEKQVGTNEAWKMERERRKEEGVTGGAEKKRKGRKERQREKAAARAEQGEARGEVTDASTSTVTAADSTADTTATAAKALRRQEKKERNRAAKKVKLEEDEDDEGRGAE